MHNEGQPDFFHGFEKPSRMNRVRTIGSFGPVEEILYDAFIAPPRHLRHFDQLILPWQPGVSGQVDDAVPDTNTEPVLNTLGGRIHGDPATDIAL